MKGRNKIGGSLMAAAVAVFLLTAGATIASADIFTSTLDFANCSNGANGGEAGCLSGSTTGPYGTVLVTRNSTTSATISFTAAAGFLFTDGSSVDANGLFTETGSITGDCSGCTYTLGSGQVDGVGSYAVEIDSGNSGPSGRSSTISFNVVANSGTTWTSADQVLTFNAAGYDAAAHIFCSSCTGTLTGLTGFAAEDSNGGGHTSEVPEPTSIALLGTAMVGLTTFARKKIQGRV